jgi:hypothetical protein
MKMMMKKQKITALEKLYNDELHIDPGVYGRMIILKWFLNVEGGCGLNLSGSG